MTVGIDDGKFFLIDNWPGQAVAGANPSSWTTYSATEDYPLGTKRLIYDDTNHGWATLIYLKFVKGTARYAVVKDLVSIDTSAMATAGQWCHVCNDGGESELQGPVAVCLGTTSATGLYGWFWCGGVCPVDTIPGLDGIHATDGSIDTVSVGMKVVDAASILKFEIATASTTGVISAFAMAVDTTS